MKKLSRIISLSLAMMMVLALFIGSTSAQEMKVLVDGGRSLGQSDVPTLDPTLATDTSSIQVLIETHPGLTRTNEVTLETEPGMATWTVSDDGLTYTFNILEGVPWVHYNADSGEVEQVMDDAGNPRYVTAEDFAYGMRRSASNADSYYGGISASWIANGNDVYSGAMDASELGVKVLDTYVLEVDAAQPAAFLSSIFGMWMNYAQPAWVVDEMGDFAWDADAFESYGPFALKEWAHGESITLIQNPFWEGTDTIPVPVIDEVQMLILEDSAAMANFEAGTVDTSPAPLADLDRIRATDNLNSALYVGPSGCTYMYPMNTAKPPMDDVRVRRALSMTIDRQSLIDNVLKGGQEPAYFFSRENLLTAAPKAEDYPDYALSYDVEGAKALIQEYLDDNGYASVDEMPTIVLMHNESEGHARIAAAIQEMWRDSLGIEVTIQTQEWGTYLDTIKSDDAPQIFRYGWCLDYTDTNNFLFDVFHSSVISLGVNWTGDSRDEFDSLVEEAQVSTEGTAARTDLYAKAEYLLTNESAVVAPIYFYTSLSLTQPWVERTYSQFGQDYFEKWDIYMSAKPGA
jgi:oligopeptide transport system substrate-binding protein